MHLLRVPGHYIARAHTLIAASAFLVALAAGWFGGIWKQLCTNSVAVWPLEWFPSVSATVGDHPGPRAPFHILIALCACPRFLLLCLQWLSHRTRGGSMADIELFVGLARTFSCGGWMYITSRDSHSLHDFFMIVYLVLTLPWMGLTTLASRTPATRRYRTYAMLGFLGTVPPLVWQYYRHSVLRVAGAYTVYAFFEWGLVVWDIAFDALAAADVRHLQLVITDGQGGAEGSASGSGEKGHGQSDSAFLAPVPGEDKPKVEVEWTADAPSTPTQDRLAFLGDLAFAVCFWTVFTSLVFQLFYWSVWELALAGSELALLANLSPLLLLNRSFRCSITSQRGLVSLRLTTLLGLVVFPAPPLVRLFGVFIGTAAGWLAVLDPLRRAHGSAEAKSEGQILLVGLLITVLIKHLNYSVNPFWATAMSWWNLVGIALGVLSVIETARRPVSLFTASPRVKDKAPTYRPRDPVFAVGLGALIHMIHTFGTDCGTVIAWTWTGYPVTGPTLHPFGPVMIVIMCASLFIDFAGLALLVPIGAAGLYYLPDWLGYGFGAILSASLLALLPRFLQTASALPPASTFAIALGTYCLLDVISVVTVAYAFVPLGNLVRERTDLVLVFCSLAICLSTRTRFPPDLPARAVRRVHSTVRRARIVGGLVASLALLSAALHKSTTPVPYYPDLRLFSGGIWTVHFGVDVAGRDSQHRMAALLRDMEVDVVGLLESDLHRMVYGNRDLTRVIAEEMGYYVDLGPGPNKHTWGAALLSKYPIVRSTHHLLPSPRGELAPAIHATLLVHGEYVNVMVSHNGQEEDPIDRELQTKEIARIVNNDSPTIFLGYLVTKPHALRPSPYPILIEDGNLQDIEIADRWRWCEYIAFRGLWRVAYARVHEGDITDTELQVGKFMLPRQAEVAVYKDDTERYWHIGEDNIPEPWRMPQMFRGEGVRGHRYVVWVGPVYYMPPVHSGLQRYGEVEG